MTIAQRYARLTCMIVALAASACALGPPGAAPETSARSACQQRADEVFQRQNRAEVYNVDTYRTDTRDAPFATSGVKGVTSAGLSQQFSHDTMVDDCLRGSAPGPQSPPMSRDLKTNRATTP
jgi:hypothetical protein